MSIPLGLSLPKRFTEGSNIPIRISNASGVDTIEIEGPDGNTKKIIGSYLKDNNFKDTIKTTLENAKASQYTAIGYGSHYVGNPSNPSSMRQMFDKVLLETKSNVAKVIPTMTNNDSSNGSSTETSGKSGKIKKYLPYVAGFIIGFVGITALLGGDE